MANGLHNDAGPPQIRPTELPRSGPGHSPASIAPLCSTSKCYHSWDLRRARTSDSIFDPIPPLTSKVRVSALSHPSEGTIGTGIFFAKLPYPFRRDRRSPPFAPARAEGTFVPLAWAAAKKRVLLSHWRSRIRTTGGHPRPNTRDYTPILGPRCYPGPRIGIPFLPCHSTGRPSVSDRMVHRLHITFRHGGRCHSFALHWYVKYRERRHSAR